MYPDEFLLYLIIPVALLICTMLLAFVFLLTLAKDKLSHPRLCFFGAILLGFSFAVPFFAFAVNMLLASWFQSGFGVASGGGSEQIITMIAMFASPLLLCLSLLFLVFSLRPNGVPNSRHAANNEPAVKKEVRNPFE